MNTQLPTLSLDASGHWEFILPAAVLPGDTAKLIVSEDGIYIEFVAGDYDLITWTDIAEIAVPGRLGALLPPGHNGASGWPAPKYILVDEDGPGFISLDYHN